MGPPQKRSSAFVGRGGRAERLSFRACPEAKDAELLPTMFHVKQNTTNPCGTMPRKGLTFSGRKDSCTGLYVKHSGEKSVLGRGGRECCTRLYVGCTPSCTGLYASCMGKRGSCTLVARQKEEIVWKKWGFSVPRGGPQTWGTILGVKKLSSRETPGNKLPGAYAKNLPGASFLHAAGWRRRRR